MSSESPPVRKWQELFREVYTNDYFMPFICWSIWLLTGTAFYAYNLNLGWAKGFYMAVNVGYSIGWGYPAEDTINTRIFSIFYVLVGVAGVTTALGIFAGAMVTSSKNWYSQAAAQAKFAKAGTLTRLRLWCKLNKRKLKIILLWFAWIAMMIVFARYNVPEWSYASCFYFALSSLSTGGLWPIPSDSPDWYFGVVGFFAAAGIPLMALAMANIASMLITVGDANEAEKTIAAKITMEELQMMQKFDLDDGDGQISRAEYILLCTVRLGALSPELIGKINERFRQLDTSGDGTLSYAEILEDPNAEGLELHIPTSTEKQQTEGKSKKSNGGLSQITAAAKNSWAARSRLWS